MENIRHQGIVEAVTSNTLRIKIEQTSACAACHAKSICLSADKKEKFVDVYAYDGDFRTGDRVEVIAVPQMGWKAVFLAYILPLFLLIGVLVACLEWLFPMREAVAAIASLVALAVYYLVLYFCRERIKKTLVFQVRHITDDLI